MKKIVAIAAMMLLTMVAAQAANNYTPAGTLIENNATLSFKVGGVSQTAIVSNTDQFKVDNKIDFTVSHQDQTIVEVVPGQTDAVLTFVVVNNGNKVQDFSLSSTANDGNPFGATDNFDATNVQIFVDSNNNGSYESSTDTATFIDELQPDSNVTVFIVANIPSTQVNNDVAEYTLVAQVAEGGTSGTQGADITSDDSGSQDNAMTEEKVFADAAGANSSTDGGAKNGKHSDNDAYKVVTATLDATKTSCVVSDPVNNTTNPHRIPGAVIRYMIDINNTGSADATNVSITDTIDTTKLDDTTVTNLTIVDGPCPAVANPCTAMSTSTESNTQTGFSSPTVTLDFATVEKPSSGNTDHHNCGYFEVEIK